MKKTIAILLAFLLLLPLCACGKEETGAFRSLQVVGTRQYCAICRGGDKLAPVINAAVQTLAGNGWWRWCHNIRLIRKMYTMPATTCSISQS